MNSTSENDQSHRLTSDMTLSDRAENMSQHDAVRSLNGQGLLTNVIHVHLVEVFGDNALADAMVTRTLTPSS
jgi:hypothetical protein